MPVESSRTGRIVLAISMVAVVGLALLLRAPDLGLKPLHSDEGVNGWFTLRLYWWNVYRYQPSDYHGPFLYYVNLVFFWLFGPSDGALRAGTVLFGSATPLLFLPLRRFLGSIGVVVAGLLVAVAPCMVYFSRTVIHETYLVFFTVVWLIGIVRFMERPSGPWALVAALGAFGAYANKETAVLTMGCLGAGVGLAWLAGRRLSVEGGQLEADPFGGRGPNRALKDATLRAWPYWLAGAGLFALLILLFFSSFFSYMRGVSGFFEAFAPWFDHGSSGRNQGKPFGYFWEVMQVTEGLAIWPAIAAMIWAGVRRHRFGLILAGWGLSSFLVYSLIRYKTPWCVLNIDLPVFMLCGWGASQAALAARDFGLHPVLRGLAVVAALATLAPLPGLFNTSWSDTWTDYDNDDVPYVYVQTLRGFYEMMQDHIGVGAADPDGDGRGPRVVNVDAKNPARWYTITRGWDHTRSRYLGEEPELKRVRKAGIVVASGKKRGKVAAVISEEGGEWHKEVYDLRPGWTVTAWYRQAHWDSYQEAGGRDSVPWPVPATEDVYEPPKPKRYLTRRDKRRAADKK